MITLSEAFRVCDIKDEPVYLMYVHSRTFGLFGGKYIISAKTIRDKLDMKKIIVHKIFVQCDYAGSYLGHGFAIDGVGLSEETLMKIAFA